MELGTGPPTPRPLPASRPPEAPSGWTTPFGNGLRSRSFGLAPSIVFSHGVLATKGDVP